MLSDLDMLMEHVLNTAQLVGDPLSWCGGGMGQVWKTVGWAVSFGAGATARLGGERRDDCTWLGDLNWLQMTDKSHMKSC